MSEDEAAGPSADRTSEAPKTSKAASCPRRHVLPVLLIVAVAAVSFLPALAAPFIGEDEDYVKNNAEIRRLTNIPTFFRAHYWNRPTTDGRRAYRPLVELTLAVDYALYGGLRPWGFRLTNLVLHALVALAVYAVAFQLSRQPTAALIAGALFAAHPVQAEAVNVIKNRGDLLGTLFSLLSWLAFIAMVERAHAHQAAGPTTGRTGPSALRGLVVGVLFFILALLSKEIAITLPIILLIYTAALVPVGWRGWAAAQTLVWWVALWSYMALSLAAIEKFTGAISTGRLPGTSADLAGLDTATHALLAVKTLGVYLWMLLFPISTGVEHPFHVPAGVGAWPVLVSLGALAGLVLACVAIFRRQRLAAFALAWLPITLLPVSNVVTLGRDLIAEHRLYFPAVGFCLLLGAVVAALARARLDRTPRFGGAYRLAAIILTAVVALYIVRSATRSLVWRSAVSGRAAVENRLSPDGRLNGHHRVG